jgi:hypothetical protein
MEKSHVFFQTTLKRAFRELSDCAYHPQGVSGAAGRKPAIIF